MDIDPTTGETTGKWINRPDFVDRCLKIKDTGCNEYTEH